MRYIVFEYIEGTNVRDLVHANGPLPLADALQLHAADRRRADACLAARRGSPRHQAVEHSRHARRPGEAGGHGARAARAGRRDGARDHGQRRHARHVRLHLAGAGPRCPRDADMRSDIYSLGCTLFFMLTGRPPFPEGTALQKLLQHQNGRAAERARHSARCAGVGLRRARNDARQAAGGSFSEPGRTAGGADRSDGAVGRRRIRTSSLPAGWSHAAGADEVVATPRAVAGAGRAALAFGAVLGIKWHRQQPEPAFPDLQTWQQMSWRRANGEPTRTRRQPIVAHGAHQTNRLRSQPCLRPIWRSR